MVPMLYSWLLKTIFRTWYGALPERAGAEGASEDCGLVLMADGVGGLDLCGTGLQYVMGSQRVPCVVKVVPWGHGFGRWHADLTDAENRDDYARKVAAEVEAFCRARMPEAPVFLVGKSGGTGVIVKALEQLPDNAVEAVVLLSPALSPRYDLSRALRAVRREMVVFWSPLDLIVLGAGTCVFGTIDRVRTVSAGLVGFRIPGDLGSDGRASSYRKLRQIRWRPTMAATGYLGGHVGPDSPAFLRKYVVPLLQLGDS
jgi:pimeloyl-ACP methyl ester carboxylesterase